MSVSRQEFMIWRKEGLDVERPALNTLLQQLPVLSEGQQTVSRGPPVLRHLAALPSQEAGHGAQVPGPDERRLALLQQDVDGEDAGLDEVERGHRHAHLLHGVEKVQTAIFVFRLGRALPQLQWNVLRQPVDLSDPPEVDLPPLLVPGQRLPLQAAQLALTEEPGARQGYIVVQLSTAK